jgi:hypothetical protein
MLGIQLVIFHIHALLQISGVYHLGHPQLIDMNMAVEWNRAEDLRPFRGLFKVFLLPPDDLFLPVIAEKIHGKLVGAQAFACKPTFPAHRYFTYAIDVLGMRLMVNH